MQTGTTLRNYVIYGVLDPETHELRYVGQSTNFKVRKTTYTMKHKAPCRRVETWVNSILEKDLKERSEFYIINRKFKDSLGNLYGSVNEAEQKTGVKHYNIRRVLNGESNKQFNGLTFSYAI